MITMIIATAVYAILMGLLLRSRYNMKHAELDFHSCEVARYAGLVAVKEMMQIVTGIYVLVMIYGYFG